MKRSVSEIERAKRKKGERLQVVPAAPLFSHSNHPRCPDATDADYFLDVVGAGPAAGFALLYSFIKSSVMFVA
jgi:hypothetical protein